MMDMKCKAAAPSSRPYPVVNMSLLPVRVALLLLIVALSPVASSQIDNVEKAEEPPPIHVFILAGQSNMVGEGSLEHLDLLIHNCSCPGNVYRNTLWNESNHTYNVRNDVRIKYQDAVGPLSVDRNYAATHHFGPELLFGWVLGDYYKTSATTHNPSVFLIKTAFGGRNLAIDFRSPLSGEGNYSNVKPHLYGWEYRQMMDEISDALEHIDQYVPSSSSRNYTIEGFVWFQGWNDMLNWDFVDEYESNLANLIRDMRVELDVPGLPIVIGELGMHGVNFTSGRGSDRVLAMRESEYNVTVMPEFLNTSRFVRTAPYASNATGTEYGGSYHYYGRADTYYHIGEAFGNGMVKLLDDANLRESRTTASNDQAGRLRDGRLVGSSSTLL